MDEAGATTPAQDREGIETGRLLFAQASRFLRGAADARGLPEAMATEIAFAGRSNVGKSSLINALTGRRDLARVSKEPGRTRELNFFAVGERLGIVDMPGYGYARAEKALVKRWQRLMRGFLAGRSGLRRVFLLIDARHGLKPPDEEIMALLDATAVSYQAVLTKADKLKTGELAARIEEVRGGLARHPAAHPEVLATSSATGAGIAELRAEIATLVRH